MEQLFSFLSHNFQFVIVILGILYYLFFRKSPAERRPPNRMPDFGGEGRPAPPRPARPAPRQREPLEADRRPTVVRETAAPGAESFPLPAETRPESLSRVRSEADAAVPYAAPSARVKPSAASPARPGSDRSSISAALATSPEEFRQPSREEMARAVLWSEILGPPRARKPFRR